MLSLDEAITHAREKAEEMYLQGMLCHANPNDDELDGCIECAKEHEQLAEWLEELKFLRQWKSDVMNEFCKYDCNSVEEARHNAYNKALYDFVKFASDMPTVDEEDGIIRPMWLEEIAEQLKEGGENNNLRR